MPQVALIYSTEFSHHNPGLIKVEGNFLFHLVAGQELPDPFYTMDKIKYPYSFDNPTYHPETPFRPAAIYEALEEYGLIQHMALLEPHVAAIEDLFLAHTPGHLSRVQEVSDRGGSLAEATYLSPGSFEGAKLAAGAAIRAVKAVLDDGFSTALSLARPPGHHAGRDFAGGFCIFNNAAIAALYALEKLGCRRVFILDWDLHHGDGTQDIVQNDPRITFCTLHQFGPELYPEKGDFHETGSNGNIINLPLPALIGDDDYLDIFRAVVPSLIRQSRPDLIIVSAGFDGHANDINHLYLYDPGAGFNLNASLYHTLTRLVAESAAEVNAPYVVLLEGGYNLQNLRNSVANTAAAMLDFPMVNAPPGSILARVLNTAEYLSRLQDQHAGSWDFC
jgi:acetoin utilization deacetylase AcuC-like enzyme